eukprot:1152615-Pelagomonas_calceolata.AAC.3
MSAACQRLGSMPSQPPGHRSCGKEKEENQKTMQAKRPRAKDLCKENWAEMFQLLRGVHMLTNLEAIDHAARAFARRSGKGYFIRCCPNSCTHTHSFGDDHSCVRLANAT